MIAYNKIETLALRSPGMPVVLIFNTIQERMQKLITLFRKSGYHAYPVLNEDDVSKQIEQLKPNVIVIGGRCGPEKRFNMRAIARKIIPDILFSEPGIEYMNADEEIVKNVQQKIESKFKKRLKKTALN